MASSRARILVCFLALLLAACAQSGGGAGGGPNPGPAPTRKAEKAPTPVVDPKPLSPDPSPLSNDSHVGNLNFDPALTPKQKGAFVTAMAYLAQTDTLDTDPKLLALMKIRRADARSLRDWIESRVQFILAADVNLQDRIEVLDRNFTAYENPGEVPASSRPANDTKASVVMSNLGVAVYLAGKNRNALFGLKTDSHGVVPVSSPRTGILRAGDGLFLVPAKAASAVKVFHLATLIHESRHSDGHGTTTGFLHAICAEGDYKGEAACDHNTNGPYVLEALVTKAFLKRCGSTCTNVDRKVMEAMLADVSQRQIIDAETKEWPDSPEGKRR